MYRSVQVLQPSCITFVANDKILAQEIELTSLCFVFVVVTLLQLKPGGKKSDEQAINHVTPWRRAASINFLL